MIAPKDHTLSEFLAEQVARHNAFNLLQGLAIWLRQRKGKRAQERIHLLITTLQQDPELCAKTAELLAKWLGSLRLYPLLISAGIFSRKGFRDELIARLYEHFNPAYKDPNDLRDVFALLLVNERDARWLREVPEQTWLQLFHLIWQKTPAHQLDTLRRYVRWEGFHAIEMLSIWIAAEALEPDLVRLDPKLLDRDSAFVAFKRETHSWLIAHLQHQAFDDSHLQVMLQQCRDKVEKLRKLGTGSGAGASMDVAHLLERLDQTFNRIVLLLTTFENEKPKLNNLLTLTGTLACATAEQQSVSRLWKRSVGMLARSITQNTSDHGEHYITRSKKEYMGMVRSAAGGGVLIALMALFKIVYVGRHITNPFAYGVAAGLNYGLGFMFIHMVHCTVATKQPAMTASRIAESVEQGDKVRGAVEGKLAKLLIDVARSQTVAVFGNVCIAILVATLVSLSFAQNNGRPFLDADAVAYQFKSLQPFTQPTLWYAAIAGVWLFCSGIISGFFDNRADYLNLRQRLTVQPLLKKILPPGIRARLADYLHRHYGSLAGNFIFGMLLGMTGWVGHLLGLPLDIRHVAFSSANLGYAAVSDGSNILYFLINLAFVLMIGVVNLLVSFSLALIVALRSRGTRIESLSKLIDSMWMQIKANPMSLIYPVQTASEIQKAVKENKNGG